jgi:predicted nucleotidyltransferase
MMISTALTIEDVGPLLAAFGDRNAAIQKLEVFGSVASGEAGPESDLDVLVTFAPDVPRDMRYFNLLWDLHLELQTLVGRKVDLVDREALRNDLFGYNATLSVKVVYERS